jgi:hypothetical protein
MDRVKKAWIIGNGSTRKGFDLGKIEDTTFGCNAIYREYRPTYIIAIDEKMVKEIKSVSWAKERLVEIPLENQFEPAQYNPSRPRENAGMVAMTQAILQGYDDLYCLGLDFLIAEENLNLANVFDGTPCYGPETRTSFLDTIARSKYFEWYVKQYPNVNFTFIFPKRDPQYVFRRVDAENVFGEIWAW